MHANYHLILHSVFLVLTQGERKISLATDGMDLVTGSPVHSVANLRVGPRDLMESTGDKAQFKKLRVPFLNRL